MAKFELFPYWIAIRYDIAELTHYWRYSVTPDGIPSVGVEPSLLNNADVPVLMSAAMDAFSLNVDHIYAGTGNPASLVDATLYYRPDKDSEIQWIYTYEMGDTTLGGGSNELGTQSTYMFRTSTGRRAKFVALECEKAFPSKVNSATVSTPEKDFTDHWTGTTNVFRARDGSKYDTFLARRTSYNDALTRKRFKVS